MDSIRIPNDLPFLEFLKEPRNRYQIHKKFRDYSYPAIIKKVDELERGGYIQVVREEQGHGPKPVKYYKLTEKGRRILEVCREGAT